MPYRLVIVDDEPDLAEAIAEYLGRLGHDTLALTDARGLLAALAARPADLVLLDLRLGEADGGRILADIVARGGPPVIMMSGHADQRDRTRLIDLGAEDMLAKPVNLREVSARIEAVLRPRQGDGRAAMRFETATADLSLARLVHDDGRIERLDAGEVALLRTFRDRAGRLVSRADLLDAAPAASDEALERAIDNRISRLRAKIGTEALVTMRGAGYRYDPVPPRPRRPD